MAGSRFSIEAVISMIDRVTGPMKTATGSVNRFSNAARNSVSRVGNVIRGFLPVISAGLMLKFANDSIKAWNESQSALANVNAGLKSTNNAIGISSKQFQDMAAKSQSVGIFEDDSILQNATAQLLTFGNIGKQNFERIQNAAMDVTAKLKGINATGEDLRGISIMMGKAMDNPVKGMAAMRRVGISFSDSEVNAVKSMMAHNDIIGSQNLMLKAIERQYGGTNEALRQTDAGMERAAQNKLGDVMERVGQQLVPAKLQFYELANDILPVLADVLPALIQFLKDFAPAIIAVTIAVIAYKAACEAARAATIGLLIIEKVLKFMEAAKILGFVGAIKYYTIGTKAAAVATKAFTIAQWLLNIAMDANPVGLIIIGIAAMIALVVLAIKYWDDWGAALVLFMGPIGIILSAVMAVKTHWGNIVSSFENGGILAGIKAIGMMLLDVVLYPLQKIIEVLARVTPGAIGRRLRGAAEMINDFRQGGLTVQNQNQAEDRRGFAQAGGGFGASPFQPSFASPMSSPLGGGRTFGQLDINVNAPKGLATTRQSGTMPQGSRINKGAQ